MTSRFIAAAVHAAPIYMDKEATLKKVVDSIHDAGRKGVKLLVFPEAFVPGYPAYIMAYPPLQYTGLLAKYADQSVRIYNDSHGSPRLSEDVQLLQKACHQADVTAVIGVSERSGFSPHTLFMSQLFIASTGEFLGAHRKLMPTHAERCLWAQGGGATLRCWDAPLSKPVVEPAKSLSYRLGGLTCGENAIYGAKQALVQAGEQVHAASWPAMCAYKPLGNSYRERIRALSLSHAYCAATFVVTASTFIKQEHLSWIEEQLGADPKDILQEGGGWSGIVDPSLGVLNEEDGLEEKLVMAEIDLDHITLQKVTGDLAGHYRRPEVLKMEVVADSIWPDDELVAYGDRQSLSACLR